MEKKEHLIEELKKMIYEILNEVEESDGVVRARRLGLIHRGFGNYAKTEEGVPLFRVRNGKLVKIKEPGKWIKYRKEKEFKDKYKKNKDDMFMNNAEDAKSVVKNTIKRITNLKKIDAGDGKFEYTFLYGDQPRRMILSIAEEEEIVSKHKSIIAFLYYRMKEIEKKRKIKNVQTKQGTDNNV